MDPTSQISANQIHSEWTLTQTASDESLTGWIEKNKNKVSLEYWLLYWALLRDIEIEYWKKLIK